MSAVLDRQDPDTTEQLEARALEKMIAALCGHIEQLANAAGRRGDLGSREAEFQLQAFAERRSQALQQLQAPGRESHEIRIARLEKFVEALDCSRAYFRGAVVGTP